jgi:hypothetical protein
MYGTHSRKRDRCRAARAQAADTATESLPERQKIIAKIFLGYRRGIRSRPIEMRAKSRESPDSRFASTTSRRTARTIDALENARRDVGRATIFGSIRITAQRGAGRHGKRVASYDQRGMSGDARPHGRAMRGALAYGRQRASRAGVDDPWTRQVRMGSAA